MKKSLFILITCVAALGGNLQAQLNQQNLSYGFSSQKNEFEQNYVRQYQKIKIYLIKAKPSLATEVKEIKNYMNLETAMKTNKISVKEVNAGGTVNTLMFQNLSSEPIMLQMGDVVQGGKQDRVVAVDVLLQAGETRSVSVFCVEHGRWSGKTSNGSADTFNSYHSNINNSVKKQIVYSNSQTNVWSEVERINEKNKTQTGTGTYTAVTQSSDFTKEIQNYTNNLLAEIFSDSLVVGILAVTGDTIMGCEIYSSPKLFRANAKNILNSYVAEAVLNGKEVTMPDYKVEQYLNTLLSDDASQDKLLETKGKSLKQNGQKVKLSAF